MNETQLVVALLPPLATLTTVIVGFLYNNSRMTDLSTTLHARNGDMRSELKGLIQAQNDVHTANLRRVEDMLLGKFAELDNRLSRIEAHLNLH